MKLLLPKQMRSQLLYLASALLAMSHVCHAADPSNQPATPPPAAPQPPPPAIVAPVTAAPAQAYSVVRVNVTDQSWDFFRPWGKKAPFTRRAVGAVISQNRVLVTGEFVANSTYIEFETPEGGKKVAASIEAVDYEANLAVLKTDDPQFLKSFRPLELATAEVGDTLSVLQLESNGAVLLTKGTMTNAEVGEYPIDESTFLLYHLAAPLQFREAAFTLPVLKDGKLAGLVMRYDTQSFSSDLVPAQLIEHFLRDTDHMPYDGFPRAGISYSNTRDPQLRRYLGLTEKTPGGVYVTDVVQGGPAAKAGLTPGDIVLQIDEQAIDQDGNYADPTYGKISASHLFSTRHFSSEEIHVRYFRKGEIKDTSIQLVHRLSTDFTIEPYVIDRAPKFYILGGLILEELSRQYLKEWGPDWIKKAPEELVYLDRYQADMFPSGQGKVVFLSRVLPSDETVGYEELHHLIVTRINDVEIHSLADVPRAVAKSSNGLHKLEFTTEPTVIYLDAAGVKQSEQILAKTYGLPALSRLE